MFENGVNAPGGMSYAAPLLDFQEIGNLPKVYRQAGFDQQQKEANQQQQELNRQRIEEGQRQAEAARAFKGGVPGDFNETYQRFMKAGDYENAAKMIPLVQQQQAANTPLYGAGPAGPTGAVPQGQPQAAAAPASIPARPLPPPAQNSPQGDPGKGTIASIVTDRLPGQDATTGQTIGRIADKLGVDPNATLTPGQLRRAQGLLQNYAPAAGAAASAGEGVKMPPSANAGSPAPAMSAAQPAPIGAGSPPTQPPQGRPALTMQTELPPGFTDPVKAIAFLRDRAASLEAANPKAAPIAERLRAKALEIEKSVAPMMVPGRNSIVDVSSGKTLYDATIAPGGQAGQLVRLENAERADRGEPAMTAKEEVAFIQNIHPPRSAPAMAVEAFKKDFEAKNGRLPTGDEITKFAASYSGEQSYGRVAGSSGARVENASNEVEQLIPQAVEASKAYARTGGKYVGLNKLFQAYDQGTSDPKYNDFVLANFSLVNAYTRAMNPQGVPRIAERMEQHAMGILSTATSQEAYETQVRRLWKEVQASKTATAKTAEGRSAGDINSPVPGLDTKAGETAPKPRAVERWEKGPDGKPRPIQ